MLKRIPKRFIFFMTVCIIYAVSYFFSPEDTIVAFGNFLASFGKVLPILAVVFFVMFLGNVFLKPQMIKRHLGEDSGLKGWAAALFGSMIFSGPPFVLFPLLRELKENGMKRSLIATFLNNRNVQPAFVFAMAYYFGLPFAAAFSAVILAYAVLSGILIGYLVKE